MNELHPMIETEARHRIAERIAQASTPRLPSRGNVRLARRLRRIADRLES